MKSSTHKRKTSFQARQGQEKMFFFEIRKLARPILQSVPYM
ncbi:hypothetical protein CHCC15290_0318 [Bacillus licheniformis]|nr:hypothetical protein CHCC15290_0318 [Bacillus licheniformis]